MLYRSTGKTTLIAPVCHRSGLLGGIGRAWQHKPRGLPEPVSKLPRDDRDARVRPRNLLWGPEPRVVPLGCQYRNMPGLTSRIWDHDLVKVFSNVYRLGHATEFSVARLMAAIGRRQGGA